MELHSDSLQCCDRSVKIETSQNGQCLSVQTPDSSPVALHNTVTLTVIQSVPGTRYAVL